MLNAETYVITVYLYIGRVLDQIEYTPKTPAEDNYESCLQSFAKWKYDPSKGLADVSFLRITGVNNIDKESLGKVLLAEDPYKVADVIRVTGMDLDADGKLSVYVRGLGRAYEPELDILDIIKVRHKGKTRWYVAYKVFLEWCIADYREVRAKDIVRKLWLDS